MLFLRCPSRDCLRRLPAVGAVTCSVWTPLEQSDIRHWVSVFSVVTEERLRETQRAHDVYIPAHIRADMRRWKTCGVEDGRGYGG